LCCSCGLQVSAGRCWPARASFTAWKTARAQAWLDELDRLALLPDTPEMPAIEELGAGLGVSRAELVVGLAVGPALLRSGRATGWLVRGAAAGRAIVGVGVGDGLVAGADLVGRSPVTSAPR